MSERTKKRPTKNAVRITVGERNPKIFYVSRRAADSVAELLSPYETAGDNTTVAADALFADDFSQYGQPGVVLKGLRARDGLTQVRLAQKIAVAQADISAMENGRRPIGKAMAKRLAKVFKADYRVFL